MVPPSTSPSQEPLETPPGTFPDEIVVEGYSDRYAVAVKELLGIEGGLSDDPLDRGGTTKYGISLRFLAAEGAFDEDGDGKADFDLDFDDDIDGQDIRKLSRGDAVFLYHRCFWLRLGAETFPRPIGEMLFDQGVNGGLHSARKLLQRAINTCLMDAAAARANSRPETLKVDGAIGNATRDALLWVLQWPGQGMPKLVLAFRNAVRERYRNIVTRFPSQQRFLRGWLARAERLGS